MKITVLCEDKASLETSTKAQHGLSLLVENGIKILFDVSQSDQFLKNAEIFLLRMLSVLMRWKVS